jgi:hypothetical protein
VRSSTTNCPVKSNRVEADGSGVDMDMIEGAASVRCLASVGSNRTVYLLPVLFLRPFLSLRFRAEALGRAFPHSLIE